MSHKNTFPMESPENNQPNQPVVDENMEKIRDLLFGQQLKQLTEKMSALESNIRQLREELGDTRKGLESAINNESSIRDQAVKGLEDNLQAAVSAIEGGLTEIQTDISDELQALRTQTDQRFDDIDVEIVTQHKELTHSLETETDRLQKEKIDKETLLADMLKSMANAMRGDAE